ncbi:transposase family protein [Streptomyces sp. NPDC058239]|uniref:transposase family protein n=1 Tax=unclassified Streptomyces TaxID=2593676 RepID=UPI003663444C
MNDALLRLEELLFLADPEVAVMSVEYDGEAVWIGVTRKPADAECPGCGRWSNRIHGSYLRFPADLPSAGTRVVLRLQVRRFACADTSCGRQTLVEQIPGLTRRHAQRTERLRSALAEVALLRPAAPEPALRTYSASPSAAARYNLGEAAERYVSRHRACLRRPFAVPGSGSDTTPPAPEAGASPWPTGHRFADRTREKHAIVHGMLGERHSRRAVARELRMTYRNRAESGRCSSPGKVLLAS